MLELPEKDHRLGYTQELVNEYLSDKGLDTKDFWWWMRGQTAGVGSDGQIVVYPQDFARYIYGGLHNAHIDD